MNKGKKKIYLVLFVICLVVAIGALCYIIPYYAGLRHSEDVNEALREEIETLPIESEGTEEITETIEETAETEPEGTEVLEEAMRRVVDFDKLQTETNADIYAWIYIPDTNIDYPVLQHPTDDTRYLNYNIDGSKGYPGCIYTEKANAKDFSDFNTVIYGHNMKNGSMFHDLHKFSDESFLEEHPYVYVYLPDKILKYEIFAAYEYDDRHLLYSFDYTSEKVREGYIDSILGNRSMSAVIKSSVDVTADSHIITMSTCIGGKANNRFLVQAVLMDDINE